MLIATRKRILTIGLLLVLVVSILSGCSSGDPGTVKLDPENPVTISVWHYYNGLVMNEFDSIVKEFNETVGLEDGIIVEGYGMGNVSDLEAAVISSAKKEVGSEAMPNIFQSYADTAYSAEQLGILADIGKYFSEEERAEYIASYIDEGKIGSNGEFRIFPIAKSTETMMLNETDWRPFADELGIEYDRLKTIEGIAEVAKLYYDWTDAKTPDVPNDGKAFFGRDAMANMFIVGAKQLGTEIFSVENGKLSLNIDKALMRRICWDTYYVPYISGYFLSSGRYRSDDCKVGDIISYIGSTSSATYFPSSVTIDSVTYPVEATILPMPKFEGAKDVLVQQGAGMVVTKATAAEEYASVKFLKWFTDTDINIGFSSQSGYMPVKTEANDYDKFLAVTKARSLVLDDITNQTLKNSFEAMKHSEMYTNKAFKGGAGARNVLEHNLQDKADADRLAVLNLVAEGMTSDEAVATFNTDENFDKWFNSFVSEISKLTK